VPCRSSDVVTACRPGGVAMPMTPADFGTFIADEVEKWRKVIRAANIKVG